MDNNNWRPIQGAEPSMETTDWRTQLQPDSRQRIVNKIMDTLKKHLPYSGQEGLDELKKIAERFEEKICGAAVSQSDYLRKIDLKMLTFETKPQIPNPLTPKQFGPTSQGPGVNKKPNLSYTERKADSKKKKRKLPDTTVVDRMVAGRSTPSGSIESSPQKTMPSQKKAKASEEEDTVTLTLPITASAYSDTSFLEGVVGSLLLPEDKQRLSAIGLTQAADWAVCRNFQGLVGAIYLRNQVAIQEKRCSDLHSSNTQLGKTVSQLQTRESELQAELSAEKARLAEVERQLAMLQADFATERRLNQKRLESLESMAGDAILRTRAELMQEFKDGKHDEWDPDHCIQLWRRRKEEMAKEAVAP